MGVILLLHFRQDPELDFGVLLDGLSLLVPLPMNSNTQKHSVGGRKKQVHGILSVALLRTPRFTNHSFRRVTMEEQLHRVPYQIPSMSFLRGP